MSDLTAWASTGMGKSHALCYTAARLWWMRLQPGANFRVLYVPEWYSIRDREILSEMRLCFFDDAEMLVAIDKCTDPNPSSISDIVDQYNGRLIVILDQVFDTNPGRQEKANFSAYFRCGEKVRIVFASSPRFRYQGFYLAGDGRDAEPYAFMDVLTEYECACMVKFLLDSMHKSIPLSADRALVETVKNAVERVQKEILQRHATTTSSAKEGVNLHEGLHMSLPDGEQRVSQEGNDDAMQHATFELLDSHSSTTPMAIEGEKYHELHSEKPVGEQKTSQEEGKTIPITRFSDHRAIFSALLETTGKRSHT